MRKKWPPFVVTDVGIVAWLLLPLVSLLLMRQVDLRARAFLNLGSILLNHSFEEHSKELREQQITRAESVLSSVASRSESVSPERQLGLASLAIGDEENALRLLQRAGETAMDFILRGQAEPGCAEAQLWYFRATEAERGLADPWYFLGLCAAETGQLDTAATFFEKGASPKRLEMVGRSDFFMQLGLLAERQLNSPDWQAAAANYDRAIVADNYVQVDRITTHLAKARALQRLGSLEEAISEYRWVVKYDPTHYSAKVRLASLIWQVEGNALEAEELLLQAVDVNRTRTQAYDGLAIIYRATGRIPKAINAYEAILELDPENREALNAIGDLLSKEER